MMIKNRRQYKATKALLAKFTKNTTRMGTGRAKNPKLLKLERDALNSTCADLRAQLGEYDKLIGSKAPIMELESAMELPIELIKARISSGLSQKDLADRMGINEQQVQRYEYTEYSGADLARIMDVTRALGIKTKYQLTDGISMRGFLGRLDEVGIERHLVKKILPPGLEAHIESGIEMAPALAKRQVAEFIAEIFGIGPDQILGRDPLTLDDSHIRNVKFRMHANADRKKMRAYTIYVDRIAGIAARTAKMPKKRLPSDPTSIRGSLSRDGLTLKGIVDYAWNLGVSTLALNDPGMFHGAYFEKDGRHVIILRQDTKSESRWMFDLLHEFWHAADNSGTITHMMPTEQTDVEANMFAAKVLLEKPEELVGMCFDAAGYRLSYLKKAITKIARQEDLPAAILADCVAYEASRCGHDMWKMAASVGRSDADPRMTVLDAFLERSDFGSIGERDAYLLQRALDYGVE